MRPLFYVLLLGALLVGYGPGRALATNTSNCGGTGATYGMTLGILSVRDDPSVPRLRSLEGLVAIVRADDANPKTAAGWLAIDNRGTLWIQVGPNERALERFFGDRIVPGTRSRDGIFGLLTPQTIALPTGYALEACAFLDRVSGSR